MAAASFVDILWLNSAWVWLQYKVPNQRPLVSFRRRRAETERETEILIDEALYTSRPSSSSSVTRPVYVASQCHLSTRERTRSPCLFSSSSPLAGQKEKRYASSKWLNDFPLANCRSPQQCSVVVTPESVHNLPALTKYQTMCVFIMQTHRAEKSVMLTSTQPHRRQPCVINQSLARAISWLFN